MHLRIITGTFPGRRAIRWIPKPFQGAAASLLLCVLIAFPAAWAAPAPYDIHAAIRGGNLEQVEAALNGGVDPNAPDSWGRTPLIVALQQGKVPLVELLISRGASVTATDAWGRTPLLVATQLKNTAAIHLLLEKQVDVNAANKNDITPLIAAAQTGNKEAAAMLLAAGAAVDLKDNLGWTALRWAEYRKDDAMIKLLLGKGAGAASSGDMKPKTATTAAAPRLSPAIDASRIVRGNPDAAITIVEYTDFQCPYCRAGARTLEEVMARYEGQVRLVVKHLPLPLLHPMAMACALYFEAISVQGADQAWAFYDRIFLDQRALGGGEAYLKKVAAELGVDMKKLELDLRSQTTQDRIAADLREAEQYKFDGVPAFVVDGRVIEGAQPAQQFYELIEAAERQ
jgi:protein-disulfide isomerase